SCRNHGYMFNKTWHTSHFEGIRTRFTIFSSRCFSSSYGKVSPDDMLYSAILQARVGRIVDGLDINLYHQSLQLRRQFEVELMNSRVT
ncbi:hypothetical protein B296_00004272, partial [Ensete ventricosum]